MTMTTTKKVLAIRERDPQRRPIDIAAEIGASREQVGRILRKHGLPTRFNNHVTQPCGWCGEPVTIPPSQLKASKSGLIFCNGSHRTKWRWKSGNGPPLKYHERVRRGLALLEAQEAVDTQASN